MQRVLSAAVACLLTANGFAVLLLGADDGDAVPAVGGTRTVTLIQSPDGTTTRVDPSTPAGQAAIEDARRSGATIVETTVPVGGTEGAEGDGDPVEDAGSGTSGPPLADTSNGGSAPPASSVDPGDLIDRTQGGARDVIDDAQEAVPTPLDGTIDDVQETVDGAVDSVQGTVTTLLGPVAPPTSAAPTTPTTTTSVQTVITDTVGGVTGGLTGGVTGGLGL